MSSNYHGVLPASKEEGGRGMGSVYYNDNDPYCCKVLRKNIKHGNLPGGYVDERDIRDVRADDLVGYQHIHLFVGIGGFPLGLKWANFPEHIRIITGGFPCQDISNAGKRAGITGERSGLWSEMYRLICDIRPAYIIVENVSALLGRGLSRVLGDLAACGYDAEWQVLSAEAFGAPHLRERVFIVAYPACERLAARGISSWHTSRVVNAIDDSSAIMAYSQGIDARRLPFRETQAITRSCLNGQNVPNPDRQGLAVGQSIGSHACQERPTFERSSITQSDYWTVEPDVGRVAARVPHRVDRLRGLGNALVPQIAQYIAACIMAYEQQRSGSEVEVAS